MTSLNRANKVTVKSNANGVFQADFYRTHKHLLTLTSPETGWVENQDATATGNRESFRLYVIENAESYGISWNPKDMRSDNNKRIAQYTNDDILSDDALAMITPEIRAMVDKCKYVLTLNAVGVDDIVPMAKTSKGTDLSALHIENGKYEKSGNWAWATIKTTATLDYYGTEIYMEFDVELVSGQLKKPKILITEFTESTRSLLADAGIMPKEDESKEESKTDEVVAEESKEEEVIKEESKTEEVKPKRGRKSKKESA